jgi:hypothetical protein
MMLESEAATAADRAAIVERLVDKADVNGLKAEDFDEMVREFVASIASDVNNGGLEEQLGYLIDGLGVQHTEQHLDELIGDRANRRKEDGHG